MIWPLLIGMLLIGCAPAVPVDTGQPTVRRHAPTVHHRSQPTRAKPVQQVGPPQDDPQGAAIDERRLEDARVRLRDLRQKLNRRKPFMGDRDGPQER